ncbi:CHAT domain-containing protein [Aquimarina pacifica]|uniref:CHAT domain-containing protein n=1 Tax=Aquimarina pacifica TaxID=1296415 RepID=UPI00046EDD56|nr:CHAT domain-containing protein [Aquimarina pacifica]
MGNTKLSFTKIVFCLYVYLSSAIALYSQTKEFNLDKAAEQVLIADTFLINKKLDSALVYFEKALIGFKKDKDQNNIIQSYEKIIEIQRENFDFAQALCNAEELMAIRSKTYPPNHPEIAFSYNTLGHILKSLDKFKDANNYYKKALTIQLENFGKNDYRTADCYHNIGTIHHFNADYNDALENYNKSLKVRVATFGKSHKKVADSYTDIGITYWHLGKYDLSIEYHKKALNIRKKIFGKKSAEVAFSYSHIGDVKTYQDQFEVAKEYYDNALTILSNIYGSQHPNTSRCYQGKAYIHLFKRQTEKALIYYKKTLSILSKKLGVNHSNIADVYIYLGYTWFKKGRYDQALIYYQKSMNIMLEVYPKTHPYLGSDYNNIGLAHYLKGEPNKAISYYKKALQNYISALGEEHGAVARTYNNIANTYKTQEKYNQALVYYKKALKIRLTNNRRHDLSASYHDLADLYRLKKNYTKSIEYYEKGLVIQIHLFGKNHYYVSDILNSIAKVYSDKEDYTKALEYLEKSIVIRLQTDGKHHPRTAKSYNQIADLYYNINNYTTALSYIEKAIIANIKPNKNSSNTFDSNQYLDHNILLQSLQKKALILREKFLSGKQKKDLIASSKTYKTADTLIQQIRKRYDNYKDKVSFAKQTKDLYAGAITTELLDHRINQKQTAKERAFYYTERSKANTLKTILAESNAQSFSGLPNDIIDKESQLKNDYAFFTSEILTERNSKDQNSEKIQNYENKLFQIGTTQDSLIQIIEENYPKYYQLKYQNTTISIADIQNKIPPYTTVIAFFFDNSNTHIFAISKNNITTTTVATPELQKAIAAQRQSITSKNIKNFKRISHQLYEQLITPIKDHIVGDQLIIIPDGPLWHLNFELLLTQSNPTNDPRQLSYMLKKYAISYINSAHILFGSAQKKPFSREEKECLAFSFSDTSAFSSNQISLATLRDASYDLPGTRKEIKAISEIIDGKYYYGSEAKESNFKKNANRYAILHLALHGEVDNERPENSKLLFTQSTDSTNNNSEDNYLYSHELFALHIPAELTVLSACNTGSGKIAKGEGIMSLGNAFQYAGTKSLVLSRWEISDQTTPQIMKYFYANLKKGMDKSKALQQAKLNYLGNADINRTAPFYWGGFYLVGDSTSIHFDNNYRLYWILGVIAFLTLGFFIFWYKRKTS